MAKNTYDIFKNMGDETQAQFLSAADFYEGEYSEQDVREFFGNPKNFVVFARGLSTYLKGSESNYEELKQLNLEAGTGISEKTLKNWLGGKNNPQGSANARNNMYKLCFMLKMNYDETAKFFSRVYLAKPFNFRDISECVYAFCLRKGLSFQKAMEMLEAIEIGARQQEPNAFKSTADLRMDITSFQTEEELVSYLTKNYSSFQINSQTARGIIDHLTELCKECILEEKDRYGTVVNDLKGKIISADDILSVILDNQVTQAAERPVNKRTIKQDSYFTEVAKLNFPKKQEYIKILNDQGAQSLEAIRKLMILLHFYVFWCKCTGCSAKESFKEYIVDANLYLNNAGYGDLYFRNPYDGLFIYAAVSHNPLDSFRDLFCTMFPTEE